MIRLSKSCVSELEKRAVLDVLDREYLGMGTDVIKFETALTQFFGRPTLCVANGTSALQLALEAFDIGAGDEVLVQSLTYVASFQAISATGATPIACDIEEETLQLDLKSAEQRISNRTKAIMPVHYSGNVGNLSAIYQFAEQYGLRVIEDAAHAFGTVYKGNKVGSIGDIACFSFDGIKNITSGEGGCVVTNDESVIKNISDARLLGVENDSARRSEGLRSWNFDVSRQGWRYHMSNIMAAIGLVQLQRFTELSSKRQLLACEYDKLLALCPEIANYAKNYDEVVPHIYPVRIKGLKNRNELIDEMGRLGIQLGFHYQPNHWLSFFEHAASTELPATDRVANEILTLPLHPDLSISDVGLVVKTLESVLDKYLETA